MTSQDDDLVRSTARLARLSVEAEEARALAADFTAILASFRTALGASPAPGNGSDSSALAPAEHAAPLRPDHAASSTRAAAILAAAPDVADGHFRVPRAVGSAAEDDR